MCALKVNFIPSRYPLKKYECEIGIPIQRNLIGGKTIATGWRALRNENMNADVGGALIANKTAYVFHIAPEQQNLNRLKQLIEQKANELMSYKDKIWGFICGGWALNSNNEISKKSFDVYNTLADKMDDMNIPFGMVCGKEIGSHYDNFRLRNNTINVWSDLITDRFKDKTNIPPEEIISNLEQDYQFVEFNPEIELYCPKNIGKEEDEQLIYTNILG